MGHLFLWISFGEMEEALPEVNDTHMGDDEVDWHKIPIYTSIQLIECEWQWRDQGWGNRKGCVVLHLLRNNESIVSERIGGIVEHNWENIKETIQWNNSNVLQESQCNDELAFKYIV